VTSGTLCPTVLQTVGAIPPGSMNWPQTPTSAQREYGETSFAPHESNPPDAKSIAGTETTGARASFRTRVSDRDRRMSGCSCALER